MLYPLQLRSAVTRGARWCQALTGVEQGALYPIKTLNLSPTVINANLTSWRGPAALRRPGKSSQLRSCS